LSAIIGVVFAVGVIFVLQAMQKGATNNLINKLQPTVNELSNEKLREFLIATTKAHWNYFTVNTYLPKNDNLALRATRELALKNQRIFNDFKEHLKEAGIDLHHVTPPKFSDKDYLTDKAATAFYSGLKKMNDAFHTNFLKGEKGDGILDVLNIKYGKKPNALLNLKKPQHKTVHNDLKKSLFEKIRGIDELNNHIKIALTSKAVPESAVEVYGYGRSYFKFNDNYNKLIVYRAAQYGRYFHIIKSEKYVNLSFILKDTFTKDGLVSSELFSKNDSNP